MSEEIKGNAVADTGDEQSAQANNSDEKLDYQTLLTKYNEEISNSKKQRKGKQDFQAKYESLVEAQKTAEEEKMIADGKLKEVIDAQKSEIKSLKNHSEELANLKASETKSLLEKIPEDKREQYENLDLTMLRNIVEDFYSNQSSNNPQPTPGATRETKVEKPLSKMSAQEKRDNWDKIVNSYKEN